MDSNLEFIRKCELFNAERLMLDENSKPLELEIIRYTESAEMF